MTVWAFSMNLTESSSFSADEQRDLILIVDDTPVNVLVLAEALSKDCRVKVATNGPEALAIASSEEKPDLILLDVMMPEMDGYEVCRHLREDSATSDIPVIFVTALGGVEDEERGLHLGAVDYITKPFQLPIVRARVRNHLKLKRYTDLLASLAMMDGLTNIANRRRFDEVLKRDWRRSCRTEKPLSLMMADLDYFKQYNDNYGHGAGDECLRAVANAFAIMVNRPDDLVARYGGEEFAAILPETDLEGAGHLAEEFRSTVEALAMPHAYSGISAFVTVSIGVASTGHFGDQDPEDLLACADRMLYRAKTEGRNRVVCGNCPAPEPL